MTGAVIGVDPGASGALALLTAEGQLVTAVDMPAHDGVVSGVLIADQLDRWWIEYRPAVAWIEQVHAMPQQGVSSTFKFGRALGCVEGALAAARLPIRYVTPAKWKKDAGLNADKAASRRRATELWPTQAELFARVKDDGRAEAALIARHGLLHP